MGRAGMQWSSGSFGALAGHARCDARPVLAMGWLQRLLRLLLRRLELVVLVLVLVKAVLTVVMHW